MVLPLIYDYLAPYLDRDPFEEDEEPSGIESVILFTLLTNNDPRKKCFYQIELLKDSLGFLKELVV